TDLDPSAPPYRGAPFEDLRNDLTAQLAVPGSTAILVGAPGSGRSVLARSVIAANQSGGAYIDVSHTARPGNVIQRIARACGAAGSSTSAGRSEIEGLLEVLASAQAFGVPVVVIDGVLLGSRAAADVAVLARAARSTRYFSLLVVGPAELSIELGGPV